MRKRYTRLQEKSEPGGMLSSQILEKRIMMNVAILGSFMFGFVFFGDTPTILSLLVFLRPVREIGLVPNILGIVGMILMGLSLKWRGGIGWRWSTMVGVVSLFLSWAFFFRVVDGNMMTFLGTLPFLFFIVWYMAHALRESSMIARLNERYQSDAIDGDETKRRVALAGFFSFIVDPVRSWLNAEEKPGQAA